MNELPFFKMHGLGNDFVIIDQRKLQINLNKELICRIANRQRGVGCDQVAIILKNPQTDAELVFFNSDGSKSTTCGNATRCIARHLMQDLHKSKLTLTTGNKILTAKDLGQGLISVNMGNPEMEWNNIPISEEIDTLKLPIEGSPTATGMGNPHCTFFVDDVDQIDLENLGPKFENHPLFPEKTNVQFASVLGPSHLRARVWERGVGITLSSGSSSCAVVVAAVRNNFTKKKVVVDLDGGQLEINWQSDGVWMTGETAHSFDGHLTEEFLKI